MRGFGSVLGSLGLLVTLAGCAGGEPSDDDTDTGDDTDTDGVDDTDDTDVADEGPFTIEVTVEGTEGLEVALSLNDGEDLVVDADGTYTFVTELEDGATYAVTVVGLPACPALACDVTGGEGTVDGADITGITVSCREPRRQLVTTSWGDDGLRFTDDVLGEADGATVTPRLVAGAATDLTKAVEDSVVVDPVRDLVYVGDTRQVLVFENASTIAGNVAPSRIVTFPAGDDVTGLSLDVVNDRLYGSNGEGFFVIDDASQAEGSEDGVSWILSDAQAALSAVLASVYDPVADRLLAVGRYRSALFVWDEASTIDGLTTPTRLVEWDDTAGVAKSMAYDACSDRVFLGSNVGFDGTPVRLLALDDASTLDGAIDLLDDAAATVTYGQAMSLQADDRGRLYVFEDSAKKVWIFEGATSWSGSVGASPALTVNGVVDRGYGMELVSE